MVEGESIATKRTRGDYLLSSVYKTREVGTPRTLLVLPYRVLLSPSPRVIEHTSHPLGEGRGRFRLVVEILPGPQVC